MGESDVLAHALEVAERMSNLDRPTLSVHKRLAHGAEASYLALSSERSPGLVASLVEKLFSSTRESSSP